MVLADNCSVNLGSMRQLSQRNTSEIGIPWQGLAQAVKDKGKHIHVRSRFSPGESSRNALAGNNQRHTSRFFIKGGFAPQASSP